MSTYLRGPLPAAPAGIVILDHVRVVEGFTYIGFGIVKDADGSVLPK
jgi:hypothetical protein